MRVLRIAPPCQLQLQPHDDPDSVQVFAGLPETTRQTVLVMLARLIARSAMSDQEAAG